MFTYEEDRNLGIKLLVNINLFGLKVSSTTENSLNLSFVPIIPSLLQKELGRTKGSFCFVSKLAVFFFNCISKLMLP